MINKNKELDKLFQPILTKLGYEMLGIEYHKQKGNSILRLYIDSDAGITIDDCVRVSDQIMGVLDVNDPIKEKYHLEVSSPGLDRPLFSLEQFKDFLGQKIKIKIHKSVNGKRRITGILKFVEESEVLVTAGDVDYRVAADLIDSARLVGQS